MARRISLGVLCSVFLLSVPSLVVHEIIEFPHHRWLPPAGGHCAARYPTNYSEPVFTVVIRQSALANGCVLFKTNLWLTGIFFKVLGIRGQTLVVITDQSGEISLITLASPNGMMENSAAEMGG